jgi:hypothetical protein
VVQKKRRLGWGRGAAGNLACSEGWKHTCRRAGAMGGDDTRRTRKFEMGSALDKERAALEERPPKSVEDARTKCALACVD